MSRLGVLLVLLALSASAAQACSVVKRTPGGPWPMPRELLEGRVIGAQDVDVQVRKNRTIAGQQATIEVTREFHGPAQLGDSVVTSEPNILGCGGPTRVAIGQRVLVSRYQSEYQLVDVDSPQRSSWTQPLALLANATMQELTDTERATLLARVEKRENEWCEAVATVTFAQVSCRASTREVRKVIYERIDDGWVEIARTGDHTSAETTQDAASADSMW